MDLVDRRRFFAEEIEAVCNLRTPALVDALAVVPREQFLRPGPWTVLDTSDGFMMGGPPRVRATPDADPARVYHNIAIAIDPERQLFNGQPGTLAVWLDAFALVPGAHILHVGTGLGYYTAVMAQAAGPSGRVLAFEIDPALAGEAARNLAAYPWVEVREGDGSARVDETFDAILINAGVTHPLDWWLDTLKPGGRMLLPLTGSMPAAPAVAQGAPCAVAAMSATIGKGIAWLLTRQDDTSFSTRPVGVVAIYSALGIRDDEMNARVGKALMGGPAQWAAVTRLRRDPHEPAATCWLHRPSCCWSTA